MSVNKYLPHVFVLPEDSANSQIANGFVLSLRFSAMRQIQVLAEVGGWTSVLERFKSDHVRGMRTYPKRCMILAIDLDDDVDRVNQAMAAIPQDLVGRVFVLGVLTEPEALRRELGSYETIGADMANDCRGGGKTTWSHDLLRHNAGELERLCGHLRLILFAP